jgi:spore germination protein KB
LVLAVWSAPNLTELAHFLGTTAPFYLISTQTVIPLLLLIVAFIRNGGLENKGGPQG